MFLCASLTGLRKHLFSSLSFTLDFRDTCPHIYCIKGTKKKMLFPSRQTTNSTGCQKNLDFFKGEVWLFADTSISGQTCVQHHFKLCIKLVPASCLEKQEASAAELSQEQGSEGARASSAGFCLVHFSISSLLQAGNRFLYSRAYGFGTT